MRTLDTTTFQSTRRSLAAILGIGQAELMRCLSAVDLDALDESRYPYDSLWEALSLPNVSSLRFERTYWHHAARVPDEWTFAEGVLPLNDVLSRFWMFLHSLVEREHDVAEWDRFVNAIDDNEFGTWSELYNSKIIHWASYAGPYAFLIGDHARGRGTSGIHDYLAIPEIVEDIARCYIEYFASERLMKRYMRRTRARIVSFYTEDAPPLVAKHALLYLHRRQVSHGLESSPHFTACNGQPIPRERVIAVRDARRAPRRQLAGPEPRPLGLTSGEFAALFQRKFV